jgi:N-acetylglutamate synthase-like GNAT family acetyltransferase
VTKKHARLTARHDLTAIEIDILEERIYEFNAARTGCHDAIQLGFVLTSDDQLIGAVAGYTWAETCELRQLWIDESFRGEGHGSALLKKAIEEARARGCASIYLATYSFQAPGFYEKFGFRPVAVIEDKPPGHRDIIMRLELGILPILLI